jgi:hypothetical protein
MIKEFRRHRPLCLAQNEIQHILCVLEKSDEEISRDTCSKICEIKSEDAIGQS